MLTEETVRNALQSIKYPGYSRDIVSFGLVKQVAAGNGAVSVQMQLTSGTPELAGQLKAECERVLRALPDVRNVFVEVKLPAGGAQGGGAPNPWANQTRV